MPNPTPTELTLGYYAAHADEFARSTADVEFSATQDRFAALLSPGARTGLRLRLRARFQAFPRLRLRRHGHRRSPELCSIAHDLTGLAVRNKRFQDLADIEAYDGIWVCSSILHLPKAELYDVLARMSHALRPHGVIYTSFKHSDFEGERNGRHFTDFTEAAFRAFVAPLSQLSLEDAWVTGDVCPGSEDELWLNLLLRKV